MTVAMLHHERNLRWEMVDALPTGVPTVTLEVPQPKAVRSLFHRVDVRALVRMRSQREIPIRHRVAAAQLRDTGAEVLLATDREVAFLNNMAELCPDVQQILIGHGVIVPLLAGRLRITRAYANRTFCVWSQREVALVKKYAPEHLRVVAMGSLRNAAYISSLGSSGCSQPSPADQICLVSSFVGKQKEDQRKARRDERWVLRDSLLGAVRQISLTWNLPIVVALKPQTMYSYQEGESQKWIDERLYFLNGLAGCELSFTNPTDRFSSYRVVDRSLATFGLFAGTLIEGFGRGNPAISVGISRIDDDFGALPTKFHLSEQNDKDLRQWSPERLGERRAWLGGDSGQTARAHYLASANTDSPILEVQRLIASHLS